MPSNTYRVVTTITGVPGFLPSSFLSDRPFICLRNRSPHQKNAFLSAGRVLWVCHKAFAQQRFIVLNKIHANIIITLLPTFVRIEEVVTKQILQYLMALSFLTPPLINLLSVAASQQHFSLALSISSGSSWRSCLRQELALLETSKEKFYSQEVNFLEFSGVSLISSCR